MGSVHETIKTVNTTLRTLMMTALVAVAGYGGYLAYEFYHEPIQRLEDKQAALDQALDSLKRAKDDIAERDQQISDLNSRVERLEVARRLLKVRRRVARLTVLDQKTDEQSGNLVSHVEFVEVNDDAQPIGDAKRFDIVGNLVYVDYLKVTFDDRYIEESDLDRGTAICLFQRIFGEHQDPASGERLDQVGTRPTAYARGTPMSDFEKKIWDDFWSIANDPARAAGIGIHAAHEVAVGMRVEPQKTYEIELRATGEMTFRPVTPAPPNAEAAADAKGN
jgi:hypothetical protein